MRRPQQMSAHPEEILHHAVDRREALQLDGRLEAPHLAFPLACRLVRDFGAVVRILIRDVNDRRHHGPRGRWVAPQFVGDQPAGYAALALQHLPENAHGGAPVPPRLHQDVEDVAVLVDRPPQILLTTVQRDEQLIEVPRVPEAPTPVPEPSGIRAAERATPPSDRLIGDRDAPLGQQVLDVTKTQAEAKVQSDGARDDVGRETIAVVAGCRTRHPGTLPAVASS